MNEELKPVRCGCGGEAYARSYANTFHVTEDGYDHTVYCSKCNIETKMYDTEAEAIEAWNRAMGERTAKVVNITHVRGYPPEGECSNCGYDVVDDGYYCPGCGCKLEWK